MKKCQIEQSLGHINPELARQWHPTKNGNLTPFDFKPFSNHKAWWICDRNSEHAWDAVIAKRSNGQGCTYCNGKKACPDNCLAVINPAFASEWHPTKNGKLTPWLVRPNSHLEVWWLCSHGHEWPAKVTDRHSKGNGCPYCSGRKATEENNLAVVNPDLARQWHPTKNGLLRPCDVKPNSAKSVWWICDTNQIHSWPARIYSRHRENVGCPICANQLVSMDNCLATVAPELAEEWHPTLNGALSPKDVVPGSSRIVWWHCKKKPEHYWDAPINDRYSKGLGCPICSHHRPSKEYNLAVDNPELCKEWHPVKNGELTPDVVTPNSSRIIWWQCRRNPTHEWPARVVKRNKMRQGCPFCNPQVSRLEVRLYSELSTIFKEITHQKDIDGTSCDLFIPELNVVIELDGVVWHRNKAEKDTAKNATLEKQGIRLIRIREVGLEKIRNTDIIFTPQNESEQYSLLCMLLELLESFEEITSDHIRAILEYKTGAGFQNNERYLELLQALSAPTSGNSLAEKFPDIANEWDCEKNGALTPSDVNYGAAINVWWRCPTNSEHVWRTSVNSRTTPKGTGCPFCRGLAVCLSNSLATLNPALAKEWHPTLNGALTPLDFTPNSNKKAWWLCRFDSTHEWLANIAKRNSGRGCPICWAIRRRRKK